MTGVRVVDKQWEEREVEEVGENWVVVEGGMEARVEGMEVDHWVMEVDH